MMKKAQILLLLVALPAVFLAACGGGAPSFAGQSHAIKLTWRATTDLNWFNERSHTLALYVVQAKDPKALASLKKSADVVLQFIAKGKEEKDIMSIEQLMLQPGGMQTSYLDLAPESGCLAIIAAYYYLDAPKCVQVFALPAGDDKKMSIDLVLGREATLKATAKAGGDWK